LNHVNDNHFDPLISMPFKIIFYLNIFGLVFGLLNFPFDDPKNIEIACFYCAWAVFNLLVLSSSSAVDEELKHIRYFSQLQSTRPAMLQLPLGRSMACTTENFPDDSLIIKLPIATDLTEGSLVQISLFKGDHELGFAAVVESTMDTKLVIRISDSAQADYAEFASAVFSRGKNWPMWLPNRDADSPMPRQLYKLLDKLRTAFLTLRHNFKTKMNSIQLPSFWKFKK
jgi:cellulose synthase (UDP-forming)